MDSLTVFRVSPGLPVTNWPNTSIPAFLKTTMPLSMSSMVVFFLKMKADDGKESFANKVINAIKKEIQSPDPLVAGM